MHPELPALSVSVCTQGRGARHPAPSPPGAGGSARVYQQKAGDTGHRPRHPPATQRGPFGSFSLTRLQTKLATCISPCCQASPHHTVHVPETTEGGPDSRHQREHSGKRTGSRDRPQEKGQPDRPPTLQTPIRKNESNALPRSRPDTEGTPHRPPARSLEPGLASPSDQVRSCVPLGWRDAPAEQDPHGDVGSTPSTAHRRPPALSLSAPQAIWGWKQ